MDNVFDAKLLGLLLKIEKRKLKCQIASNLHVPGNAKLLYFAFKVGLKSMHTESLLNTFLQKRPATMLDNPLCILVVALPAFDRFDHKLGIVLGDVIKIVGHASSYIF